jgi:pimeloyl-ACP methyl ester carboxylesterase
MTLKLSLFFRLFGLLLCIVLLPQCSAPISVRSVTAPIPVGAEVASADIAQQLLVIRDAHDRIKKGDASAIPSYNYTVGRLIESLEASGADPWSMPMSISGAGGIQSLKGIASKYIEPVSGQLLPADTLRFSGEYADYHAQVSGVGAPIAYISSLGVIGHRQIREKSPMNNLTAIVRFEGQSAKLELIDPYQAETVVLAGKSHPLAADFRAATMYGLSKSRIDKLGLARLLRPSRYNDTANLNFVQPYDPKRIPILLVHGLQDTPASFVPLYLELLKDPVIRKNYQFWVFSYPSGYPYPYSASLLRNELNEVKDQFPNHKNIVIIGHSMGGLISRLMVTDVRDKLWIKAFGKSPSETNLTGASHDLLMDSLVFHDRKEIDRAIFFSAPHRGSVIASNWIGSIASRLVKMPSFFADVRDAAYSVATIDLAGVAMQKVPNSIGTLKPNNPFVVEINKHPIVSRVPYHSVVGDRGKGDTPNSSDGVVAYWSSHLDGADSEKIVPSGHSSHQDPEGIAEARRILLLHLKNR